MNCLLAVSVLCCASAILADQLPYPLQLFYLTPNNVGVIPPYQTASSYVNRAVDKMKMAGEKPSPALTKQFTGDDEMVEGEASQFHSQDSRGRALFGYTTPDQARVEARSEDGKVRGSYSYLDAWGKAVKVQYWDDGTGFHAAGNNLPGVYDVPQPVQDTPEVMAAKEQHFQLFQQALAAAVASTDEKDSSGSQKPQQTPPEQEQEAVVVESDDPSTVADDDTKELTRYPNLQLFPQNLFDPTQIHDANREAVIVDNPDLSKNTAGNNLRSAKTFKSGETSPGATEGLPKLEAPGGFFYSFRYPVPVYVQVRTVEEGERHGDKKKEVVERKGGLSVSQKAALFGAIPVAAVHDAQVPPHLMGSIKNYQVMPLYLETAEQK